MSLILDIILVAIFAAYVIFAAKKGFIRTLLELVAVFVAIFLSFQLSPVFAQSTYDGFVESKIVGVLEEEIDSKVESMSVAEKTNAVVDAIPDFAVSLASSAGVDISNIKAQISGAKLDTANIAQSLVDSVVEPIVVGAMKILFFIIMSIILIIVLKIAAKYISKLFDIPMVKSVNRSLGGVLGAIKGVVVLLFICTVLRFVFGSGDGELAVAVNDSIVVGMLDNINPLIDALKEFVK